MSWTRKLKLVYRIRARVHRDVADEFDAMLGKLHDYLELSGERSVEVGDMNTLYAPIDPTLIEAAKKEGLLILAMDGWQSVVVREWAVFIDLPFACDQHQFVAGILEATGEVFTNIEIHDVMFTDVGPA